jgi:membrane protein involved in colicin uptake
VSVAAFFWFKAQLFGGLMKYGYFKGKKVAEVQDSHASLMDKWKKQGLVDEWRDAEPDPEQAAEKAEAERLAAEKAAAEKAEAERLAAEKEAAKKAKDQHLGGGSGPTGSGGDDTNAGRGYGGGYEAGYGGGKGVDNGGGGKSGTGAGGQRNN